MYITWNILFWGSGRIERSVMIDIWSEPARVHIPVVYVLMKILPMTK